MLVEILLLSVITSILWSAVTYIKRRKMPPGPFPLPFVGNVYQLGSDPPFSMEKLRKQYGETYTVVTPVGDIVIVNNGKLAQEALVTKKDDFAGRPQFFPAYDLLESKDLLVGDYGPFLPFRRKLVISALHIFGEGKRTAEDRVNREVRWLLEEIEGINQPFFPKKYVMMTMISIILDWLFSERYELGDPVLEKLYTFNENMLYLNRQGSYYQILPFLKYLPTEYMKRFALAKSTIKDVFWSKLNDHLETYTEGTVRDITDALIQSYENEKDKNCNKGLGTIDDLRFILVEMFVASTDSSSSVITWLLLYMIRYEEVQDKIHQELDLVVRRDWFIY